MMPRGASLTELQALYEREYPRLLRLAWSITADRAAAQDAVQDAFVSLIRHRKSYRGEGNIFSWAGRSVAREALRQRSRASKELGGEMPEPADPSSQTDLEQLSAIRNETRRLPERQRHVLFLRYFGDLAYDEIADILGVSVGTVSSTIHDAQAALKPRLEEVHTR
jgi:RNA polymerase sigma factor (sigma-70 family)